MTMNVMKSVMMKTMVMSATSALECLDECPTAAKIGMRVVPVVTFDQDSLQLNSFQVSEGMMSWTELTHCHSHHQYLGSLHWNALRHSPCSNTTHKYSVFASDNCSSNSFGT